MHGRTAFRKLTLLCFSAVPSFAALPAFTQETAEETLEEIVVTGTRRPGRTVVDSSVPIDVLQGKDFRNIGTNDMDDVLRTLIPAYNVRRYPLHDESSLVRPAELRGLPPDNTLVLINGKRLHRSAVLASAVRGAQGPDLSTIPSIALGASKYCVTVLPRNTAPMRLRASLT